MVWVWIGVSRCRRELENDHSALSAVGFHATRAAQNGVDDNSQAVLVETDPFIQFFSQTEGCGMTREFCALFG